MKSKRSVAKARSGSIDTRWSKDDHRTIESFTRSAGRFGLNVQSVQWGSTRSQQIRFKVLADIGDLRNASVLDVGCGLGDLPVWLQDQGIPCRYTGVDLTPQMIHLASTRLPSHDFRVGNILDDVRFKPSSYDYVFASGIFFLRQYRPQAYLQAMVSRMYEICRIGVGFNSLSPWVLKPEPGEFAPDPLRVVPFCRKLTHRLRLLHDYHPGDFTIHLYKEEWT